MYRKINSIPNEIGTAVNVQGMVFGNLGEDCATGVAFTRNPSTGEKCLFGEFLTNAQGEDVVAGTRTPQPIDLLKKNQPQCYRELAGICERLEKRFADMQDLEFTIQRGKLWMLQTRTGKRTARAMVRIAVDMVNEGLVDKRSAVVRLDAAKLDDLLHPTIDPKAEATPLARGLNASPGAAVGRVVFTATEAEQWAARDESVILCRTETSPEDIHGMQAAVGIITARGGMTSHAAVVARGMGKSCVTACSELDIDLVREQFSCGETVVKKGDTVTLDGSTGALYLGPLSLVPAQLDDEFAVLMAWVDESRRLKVRTNADTPHDAKTARAFGAEGIGLCRTEHMFFEPERIQAIRRMIIADSAEQRRAALDDILPMQVGDFTGIFREMNGLPVTIRLLDPPLHEFLPQHPDEIATVAASLGVTADRLAQKVENLREVNPMLGHRGCRLAILYPEIYEIQAQAIGEAAAAAVAEGDYRHTGNHDPLCCGAARACAVAGPGICGH